MIARWRDVHFRMLNEEGFRKSQKPQNPRVDEEIRVLNKFLDEIG